MTEAAWQQLVALYEADAHRNLFGVAFSNGRVFARSDRALRQRHPNTVEWSGPFQAGWTAAIPADIRVDDVYLVSCKYDSKILHNTSPARFFESRLTHTTQSTSSWYEHVAPDAYQRYFAVVRTHYELDQISNDVRSLTAEDRATLKRTLPRQLPPALVDAQAEFCFVMATASAARWTESITTLRQRQEFALNLLRIPQAIYFLLGFDSGTPLRFKVASRWDWAKEFEVKDLRVCPRIGAMQPTVDWTMKVVANGSRVEHSISGHVEVRWSHGRFLGAPEAKVKLDTPVGEVPGYFDLDE